jgi:xanthine/CO dehydrogenase XdhC/CoxF family maturation factor
MSEDQSWGAVSAGCLEDEVISVSKRALSSGCPEILRFDTTEEMDIIAGTGLGCRGTIDVLVEPIQPNSSAHRNFRVLRDGIQEEERTKYAVVLESDVDQYSAGDYLIIKSDQLVEGSEAYREFCRNEFEALDSRSNSFVKTFEIDGKDLKIYGEKIDPRPHIVIFGAGFDAQPLAQFSSKLGFRVSVIDHRKNFLQMHRFPNADKLTLWHPNDRDKSIVLSEQDYLVIMTHNYLHDLEILKIALASEAAYVGQIGPRDRTDELIGHIKEELGPISDQVLEKLYYPIGLDLGAETPEEIALSIMSEILAIHNRRCGGFLKKRQLPIHNDN